LFINIKYAIPPDLKLVCNPWTVSCCSFDTAFCWSIHILSPIVWNLKCGGDLPNQGINFFGEW
jgi:hypothetical protein